MEKMNFDLKTLTLFFASVMTLAVLFIVLGLSLGWVDISTIYIFVATLMTGICSLILGIVSLYNEQKAEENRVELEQEKDRQRSLPIIRVDLDVDENDSYILTIRNHSNVVAIDLFFFEIFVFKVVKPNTEKNIKLSKDQIEEYCSSYYVSQTELLRDIHLFYCDNKNRLINQYYKYNESQQVYETSLEDIKYI